MAKQVDKSQTATAFVDAFAVMYAAMQSIVGLCLGGKSSQYVRLTIGNRFVGLICKPGSKVDNAGIVLMPASVAKSMPENISGVTRKSSSFGSVGISYTAFACANIEAVSRFARAYNKALGNADAPSDAEVSKRNATYSADYISAAVTVATGKAASNKPDKSGHAIETDSK